MPYLSLNHTSYVVGVDMRCILILFFNLLHSGSAWDSDGHKMVAKMAAGLLTKRTARFVLKNIQGRDIGSSRMTRIEHSLVSVASWADYISETLPWSRELHFSNTPYRKCQEFELSRDCDSDRCVVTAIANYTTLASSFGLAPEERGEALKFLIHLVADIHSPMHVAFAKDFGGNAIPVLFGDGAKPTTLHEVWDRHIIDAIKGDRTWKELVDSSEVQSLLRSSPTSGPSTADALEFATEIASETSTQVTCNLGYKGVGGAWIKPLADVSEYIEDRKGVVLIQLVRSAHRLAALLEAISADYNSQKIAAEIQIAQSSSSASGSGSETSFNRFSILEDIAFDVEDPMDLVDEVEIESTVVPTGIMTEEATVSAIDPSLTLDDLVLIIRKGAHFIVPRRRVHSNRWIPSEVNEHRVPGLYHDDEALVRFDASIPIPLRTGESAMDVMREIIVRLNPWLAMGFLSKLYLSPIPEIRFGSVPFNQSLAMAIPAGEDRTEFSLAELRRNSDKLVLYYGPNILVVTSYDLVIASIVADQRGEMKYTAIYNTFEIENIKTGSIKYTWIDARVYDGDFSGELVAILLTAHQTSSRANHERLDRMNKPPPPSRILFESLSDFIDLGATSDAARVMSYAVSQINHVPRPSGERFSSVTTNTIQVVHRMPKTCFDSCRWTDRYGNFNEAFFEPLSSMSKRGGIDLSPIQQRSVSRLSTHDDDILARNYIASIEDRLVIFQTRRFYFVTLFDLLWEDPKTNTFTVTFVPIGNGGGGKSPDVFFRANMDFLVVDERVHVGSMAPIVDVIVRASKKRIPRSNLNKLLAPGRTIPHILYAMEVLGVYRNMVALEKKNVKLLSEMKQGFNSIRPVLNPQYRGLLRTYQIKLADRSY